MDEAAPIMPLCGAGFGLSTGNLEEDLRQVLTKSRFRVVCFIFLLCLRATTFAQQAAEPQDPVLTHRPAAKTAAPMSAITPEGKVHLDVVVTDANGKTVSGLEPQNFKLLDDGQARKILSMRSFDGVTVKPNPAVEVILIFDTANLPFPQFSFTRQEIEKFLRQNGGRLAQPVLIMVLSDAGLRVQPRSSTDGYALLAVLDVVKGSVHTISAAQGAEGDLERFQLSVRQMTAIAENEATRPGRKLLIWVGPGWPMLDSSNFGASDKDQRRYFEGIVELSSKLREARMAVYSVSPGSSTADSGKRTILYQDFLKAVKSARHADSGNLALKVLATQSGGLILGPDNDLAGQIDRCVAEANGFYTLSFDPPHAAQADEYHELKVQVDQPGLTARTNTGYYNQPQQAAVVSQ
jgi:VWFA-related protein